ncbi:MAG TPA: tetratricopeptide repeat protein [Candidatus Methylomirabilis sp.]|nr:tetratricopeptide repeat protein [Candidatus Methylomirabilis sp.]
MTGKPRREAVDRDAATTQRDEGSSHHVARTADRYREEGRFDDAIMLCLQELSAHPTYVSARVVLARAYLESRDYDKAEAEFRRVVELSPGNLRARVHLGEICAAQGLLKEAIGHYEAALEFAPLDREIRTSLSRLRASLPPSTPPVSPLRASHPTDLPQDGPPPSSAERNENLFATETLADLYASQGLTERAAAIYQQLLDEQPLNGRIREKLSALGDRRQDLTGLQVKPAAAPPIERPAQACHPESASALPQWPRVSKEVTGAGPANLSRIGREQMLIEALERWLNGVRRYCKPAAMR